MTQIGMIILAALEENDSKCLDNEEERSMVAEECERALLQAIGKQLQFLEEQHRFGRYSK
jgi:hypothetical protein